MKKYSPHVGIVMLLYNRADVAIACLRSLVQAKSEVRWEIYLLDNASQQSESDLVKIEFNNHATAGGLKGQFIRSEINHGFPKGNNLGIRYFMEQSDISHICLLNSDVIVTDYWLDRLLEKNADAIGPVTNACGNEQTIPVVGSFEPTVDVFDTVNKYAQDRYDTYQGYCKSTNFLGFFCFIARMELFLKVGFLDERFGQGAYEDDDYCLRILAAKYQMTIARDVFIHHWGSASFLKIPPRLLSRILVKNRHQFELKHKRHWQDRSLLPVRGVFDDLEYISHKAIEVNPEIISNFSSKSMDYLNQIIIQKNASSSVRQFFAILHRDIVSIFTRWFNSYCQGPVYNFLKSFVCGRSIVVLGRFYPTDEHLKDGYFQRVCLIDENLADYCRIYIRYEGVEKYTRFWRPIISYIKPDVYEVDVRNRNILHCIIASIIVLISGRIYVHSVLRFDLVISRILYRLARKRIFDIHGIVPEEFCYEGDDKNGQIFGNYERWGVNLASRVVVVTHSMANHLIGKYTESSLDNYLCMSMLPRFGRWCINDDFSQNREGIIYSGGLHKWQQVDKMLDYVKRNAGIQRFTFLVTDPAEIKRRYLERYGVPFPGEVTTALPNEVAEYYKTHAYGLVFREDIEVNRVACPTKLVEYLQYGLIPIVDCPDIGDFNRYGYRYLTQESLLPDNNTRMEMLHDNFKVLKKLYYQFICDSVRLVKYICDKNINKHLLGRQL